ncbi:hypothetical protein ACHAPT_013079 [Fusarium lateritium]
MFGIESLNSPVSAGTQPVKQMAYEPMGVLFQTTDPFHSAQWSDPTILNLKEIDPDLFWDDDGKTYVATAGITLQEVDLKSGKLGEPLNIWNGTANEWPEGPHIYKKDGWYYLLIAEGGTGQGHAVSMARARSITGPYTAYKNNPILTNRDTNEYFQSVGHADLFQTSNGDWWGVCLAIRTGPSYELMPMGREAALFNVTWKRGEWPQLQPVRGRMSGDRLPGVHLPALGNGPTAAGDDGYDFTEVTTMPPHFIHHRVPPPNASSVTRKGLMIKPSRANLTGDSGSTELELTGQRGLSLIGRRQAHTLFAFSLDLEFRPQADGQEAGITVFRSQHEHINLGIVRMESKSRHGARSQLVFRLAGASPSTKVSMQIYQVPQSWEKGTIRLEIQASNASVYTFAAMPVKAPQRRMVIGTVSAGAVSGLGGKGFFLGSFIGAFATCNGAGSGQKCPEGGDVLITRWIYKGLGQQILVDEIVPEVGLVSP